jgi:hypothetical protein
MDLTRLYNFTTPELREEAERLGVRDTYALSRGQLIQAIREHLEPPTAKKRGLFGTVVGLAKWAVQAATEAGSDRAPAVEPEPAPVAASEPAPTPVPEPAPVPVPVAGPVPVPAPMPALESEPELEPELEPEPAEEPAPDSEAEPLPSSVGSSRPPAGVFASNGGLFEEPIPTRTMARILAEQGHFKRSLAIYARLLDEEPDDGDLIAEVEAVREEAKARRSYAPQ